MDTVQMKNGETIIRRSKDEIIEMQTHIIESQMRLIDCLRKRILELEGYEPLLPLIKVIPEISENI